MSNALQRRAISDPIPPKPRTRAVVPASPLFSTVCLNIPRRISSVRATISFAAARRSAIACSATETLYAPALLHTIADGGNRSNGKWSTPATSDWIIRTFRAFSRKSSENSRGNPMDTTTSAVDHAASRFSGGKSSRITGSNTPAAFFATAARRSASIGTMNRTRAMGPPTAPRDLALSTAPPRSAFRVPARVALDAAFLEHEGLAALRTLRVQAFPQQLRGVAGLLLHLDVRLDGAAELVVRLDGRLDSGLLHADVPLDRLRDRVRDRIDALPVVDRDPRAPDALELVDDLIDRDAGPQAERDEARDAFRERRGVAAASADLREHLEEAFFVLVDRDVQGAVPGENLLRPTGDHVGTGSRPDDRGPWGHFDVNLFELVRLRDADVEDLVLARAVAVDRDAFAVEVEREQVRLLHVLDSGLPREIDRLRDRGVAPVLEGGLHSHMPFRRDVVGRREDLLPLLRDFLQAARGSVVLEDLLYEIVTPESLALRDFLEVVEEVRELLTVHHSLVPDQAELGLAAAGRIRDHRERAGRRDRGDVRVPEPEAFLLVSAALPRGVNAALLRELRTFIISGFMDKLHDLATPFDSFFGIVRDLEHEQHSRETHDAKADLTSGIGHLFDLLDRVRVHVDDVIEHADRRPDRAVEFLPIDFPTARRASLHVASEVDRTEIAGLVRQERLFPAWVRCLHIRDVRRRLPSVVLVDKEETGLSILPGLECNLVEDLAGIELPDSTLIPRIHEVVRCASPDGLHELVCNRDGDVEISDFRRSVFAGDELQDIGVVDA